MYLAASGALCLAMSRGDGYDGERSIGRRIGFGLVALIVLASGWFVARTLGSADDAGGAPLVPSADTSPAGEAASTSTVPVAMATSSAVATTVTTDAPAAPTTSAAVDQAPPSPTAVATAAKLEATPAVTYSTLPDGSASPVLALFDEDTITLSGTVPSEASAERLMTLTLANSTTPAALLNLLTIDPNVPPNVGVRIVELTSPRFAAGGSEIGAEHAREFDRVAALLTSFPNVTALVIGHADQRGSEAENFEVSDARARAVVAYLVSAGVSADRLSARAVGEADLLSLSDDATALALNRRTEFVIYGLLAAP